MQSNLKTVGFSSFMYFCIPGFILKIPTVSRVEKLVCFCHL
jgi:hypothetical protein